MRFRLQSLTAAFLLSAAVPAFADVPDDAAKSAIEQGSDAFAHGDFPLALQKLAGPAHNGNPTAETLVGLMSLNGLGTPKDVPGAIKLFQLAADQGEPQAEFM